MQNIYNPIQDKIRSTSSCPDLTHVYIGIGSTCMYKGHFRKRARLAQSVQGSVYEAQGCGFDSHCGQDFFNLYFDVFPRALRRSTEPKNMK